MTETSISNNLILPTEKDKTEYDEMVADLFWKLNRTNRRKVLNKSAKWKAHVYKSLSKKNGKSNTTGEGTAD